MGNMWECVVICRCVGWLTANETLRNIASERAAELSDQYAIVCVLFLDFLSDLN